MIGNKWMRMAWVSSIVMGLGFGALSYGATDWDAPRASVYDPKPVPPPPTEVDLSQYDRNTYQAWREKVIDGDTVMLRIEVHRNFHWVTRGRIRGVNSPETRGPDKELGKLAKRYTEAWVGSGPLIVTDHGDDKYGGRTVVTIRRPGDDETLAQALIRSGHGRPYPE